MLVQRQRVKGQTLRLDAGDVIRVVHGAGDMNLIASLAGGQGQRQPVGDEEARDVHDIKQAHSIANPGGGVSIQSGYYTCSGR